MHVSYCVLTGSIPSTLHACMHRVALIATAHSPFLVFEGTQAFAQQNTTQQSSAQALGCYIQAVHQVNQHDGTVQTLKTNPLSLCCLHKSIEHLYLNITFNLRNRRWSGCVYVLQMFFCFLLFFRSPQKYQTTVLGNGWTDFHETFTKR